MDEDARINALNTQDEKVVGRPFKPGNPGRPKGTKNKFSERFVKKLYLDFKEHGEEAIRKVRDEKPDAYLKVIASILPKDVNLNVDDASALSDEQLIARIRRLDSVIRPFLGSVGVPSASGGTRQETTH